MKSKKIPCERCGSLQDKSLIRKHKDKKNYCLDCRLIVSGIDPKDLKPVSQKEFDETLKKVAGTPSLKLKGLKEKLKKEQKSKEKSKKK